MKRSDRIGYCTNKDLGLKDLDPKRGHYVYVEKRLPNGKSKVHTISAIEHKKPDKNHDIPIQVIVEKRYVSNQKLIDMREGKFHPIAYSDANFNMWSGFYDDPIMVDTKKIQKPTDRNNKPIKKFVKKRYGFLFKKSKKRK